MLFGIQGFFRLCVGQPLAERCSHVENVSVECHFIAVFQFRRDGVMELKIRLWSLFAQFCCGIRCAPLLGKLDR